MAGTIEEQRDGIRWFVGALIIAVLFCVVLVKVDYRLTNSTRETDLEATLKELRGAQTTLSGGPIDERITSGLITSK